MLLSKKILTYVSIKHSEDLSFNLKRLFLKDSQSREAEQLLFQAEFCSVQAELLLLQ